MPTIDPNVFTAGIFLVLIAIGGGAAIWFGDMFAPSNQTGEKKFFIDEIDEEGEEENKR